ncbi:MAG TPA: transglutaminase-like domain-containing protein, partial [Chitinophagaceae bacterium]|nr:transglutaminase-like domain-containing protein [Chitinophagaceae bacterium]
MKRILTIILLSFPLALLAKENYKLTNKDIPKKIKNKIGPLSDWICEEQTSDSAKSYAIFYWVTHNIEGDSKSFNKQSKLVFRKPDEILKRRKAVAEEYAYLLQAMMQSQHLMCQVIFGYEKNELYE